MVLMNLSIPEKSFDAAAASVSNGTAFAFPVRGKQVIWRSAFGTAPGAISLVLQNSEDNVNWNTIDTSIAVAGETRTVNTAAPFIRARIDSITGGAQVSVFITATTGNTSADVSIGSVTVSGTVATTASDGSNVVLGATTGSAIVSDIAGTIQGYLRGLVKLIAAGIATTVTGSVTANAGTNLNTSALATAAKQPALGTAGSASPDIITIQGVASMTKLLTTPDSVALPNNQSVNVSQINTVTPLMGAGNTGTGSPRVTIASDQAVIPINDNSGSLTVDAPVGTPVFVTPTPSTTGGWLPSKKAALSNTNAQVKSGAGTLGGWFIYNPNASVAYVQIYDTATGSITVGTTAAVLSIGIPAGQAANLEIGNGINFATAICVAATTTAGGGSAPSTALDCNFWYK